MEDLENDDSDDDFVPIPKVKKEKKSKNVDLIGEWKKKSSKRYEIDKRVIKSIRSTYT